MRTPAPHVSSFSHLLHHLEKARAKTTACLLLFAAPTRQRQRKNTSLEEKTNSVDLGMHSLTEVVPKEVRGTPTVRAIRGLHETRL